MLSYLHPAQVSKLLSVIRSPRDKAIFTVAYFRGLRASEVGMLRLDDYRPAEGRLRIGRLKGSVSGEWRLTPQEQHALTIWLRKRGEAPGPLFPSRLKKGLGRHSLHALMRKYGELADLPPNLRHFHVLKHSIATHLLERGEDAAYVQDQLGHKDIRNTMVYAQITNRGRDAMADRVAEKFKDIR